MTTKTPLFLALLYCSCLAAFAQSPDVSDQNRRLGRSVNILNQDPIWRSRERSRFQAAHFTALHNAGFNSVRISLHPFQSMDATNGWKIRPSWYDVLDWAINGARSNSLAAILDLHEYESMARDPAANKEKLLSFWRQASERYQNAPDDVFFEILNEPNGKLTPELWNSYLAEAIAIIREKNPTRAIIVGPGNWNSVDRVAELKLPERDHHLILTVHYYIPMEFTHQGASWTGQQDKVGIDWAGSPADLARIGADFDKVDAWAKSHGRPVFLGEFGAYDKGAMEARARYLSSVVRAAEKRGWSWGYWQFDGDFILYDVGHDAWVQPILRALVPDSPSLRQ